MKVLIILAVALLVRRNFWHLFGINNLKKNRQGVRADWDVESDQCVAELKLNKETIQALNKNVVPEDDADFNKYLECYWKKLKILKANGDIDWGKVKDYLVNLFKDAFPHQVDELVATLGPVLETAIESCKSENLQGTSYGQKIAKLQNCIVKTTTIAFQNIDSNKNWKWCFKNKFVGLVFNF